jgi:hypothetical protein
MQNKKETVIKINGETIRMREFKDFSLDVLVYCTAHGIVNDGEDDAILDFIQYVNAGLDDREPYELTKDKFFAVQTTTGLVLSMSTDLFCHVEVDHLIDFINVWTDLLFTDTLGSTFKETAYNLSNELYGRVFHLWM